MEHFFQKIEGWFTFPYLYSQLVLALPQNGTFVEIGSWKGQSLAFFIVESINQKKTLNIHAVDTWAGSDEHKSETSVVSDTLFDTFKQNIAPVADHFTPHRMTSAQASRLFAPLSIDAVFIDASHAYADVKEDLQLWYPKVKSGGFVSGHDYSQAWPGVIRAVNDFYSTRRNEVIQFGDELSWIARKP